LILSVALAATTVWFLIALFAYKTFNYEYREPDLTVTFFCYLLLLLVGLAVFWPLRAGTQSRTNKFEWRIKRVYDAYPAEYIGNMHETYPPTFPIERK